MTRPNVRNLQRPLRDIYAEDPSAALVTDTAVTGSGDPTDPFHGVVLPLPRTGVEVPISVHSAHAGPYDAPTPGDVLCAALASCQDITVRMVANILAVELEHLSVTVEGDVDVRGSLMMPTDAPVGFSEMRIDVELRAVPGTPAAKVLMLEQAARRCCVVLQTLRTPPKIDVALRDQTDRGAAPITARSA